MRQSALSVSLVLGLTVLLCAPALADRTPDDGEFFKEMKYRHIGPEGNRTTTVVGIPGNPRIYYTGAASGGVWKTTDGGTHWEPIFDDQSVQSIGAMAIAPSDANVVWVGTGEANIRSHISLGAGVFKSTDAGKNWELVGLENTGRISRIVVDPRDPDTVFVAAQGHSYGPQKDRGVFRTRDGGQTWTHILFVDEDTGASDLAMDPNNPRILFAGTWQLEIHTWGRTSGGPGSGIHMSRDGGDTWKRLSGNGLPKKPVGKVALAVAPSDSNRIYALIETGDGIPMDGEESESGELWRSDDGGESWLLVSHDRQLAGRTHYYSRVGVAPDNANEAFFLSAAFSRTVDGGATTIDSKGKASPWGDNHDIWIDPLDPDRMAVANDGGVDITVNRGASWRRIELPIAQMYHVTVDSSIPYFVYGNRQDGESARGPSRTHYSGFIGSVGKIPRGAWRDVGGGESGWATPDPEDPNIIWSSTSGYGPVGGIVSRMDLRTHQVRDVEVWPRVTGGWPAGELKYRFVWDPPLTISPHDHNKIYTGSQHVHVTTDGGQSWQVISPDLSLNDAEKQKISGWMTPDNIGVEYAGVVFAIAESRLEPGLIWVGTNDGLVHVTTDGGTTWTNVTDNIPNMPVWGTVNNIEPSRYDRSTAYLTVDAHQANNRDPWVYKTTDLGKSWEKITSGLPVGPVSYANCIREDPVRPGLLYLGTESAVYVSFDDGAEWQPFQTNLPHAPAYWLVVQEEFNDLVVGTYGRGFWILDDITPLQLITDEIRESDAHLFAPRHTYRFRPTTPPYASFQDPVAGTNPPYGASINYYVGSEPEGEAKIEILDADGQVVRVLKEKDEEDEESEEGSENQYVSTTPGLHRIWWDLRYDRTTELKLRTSPSHAPWVKVGDKGWRTQSDMGRFAALAPPGQYTIQLTIGDTELSQTLEVRKDPNSSGTEEDIATQTQQVMALRDRMNDVADMVNTIESVRGQLHSLKNRLDEEDRAPEVSRGIAELDEKLIGVEGKLIQLKITGRGQDGIRWPAMLGAQLAYLAESMSTSDYPPTQSQLEVKEVLEAELKALQSAYQKLMTEDVVAFNRMLAGEGLAGMLLPESKSGVE
ncbi:MAG: sialidase [bacterium]|nr:sialidase [bacterium]